MLLDATVFIYAVGGPHPYRDLCRRLVTALGDGTLDGHASVLVVQEVLHQRARRTGDRHAATRVARDVGAVCTLHEVTRDDLRVALDLFSASDTLGTADAVHAATAINRDLDTIVTSDTDFDDVPMLRRIDPMVAVGRLPSTDPPEG